MARGEDTAHNPRRKVGREEMGTYNQELASWRAADASTAAIQSRDRPGTTVPSVKGPYYDYNEALRKQRGG